MTRLVCLKLAIGVLAGAALSLRAEAQCFIEVSTLEPPVLVDGEEFGEAVALSGPVAVVGAPEHFVDGLHQGAAYVYRDDGSGWSFEAELIADDGGQDDDFADAVAVEGDLIAVGAPFHDELGDGVGAAYVYRFDAVDGWELEQKLLPSNPVVQMQFGTDLAMSSGRIVVSAPSPFIGEPGRVYVYEQDGGGWTETAVIVNPDATPGGDAFGNALDLDGDRLAVGAELDFNDDAGLEAGAVHVFEYDGMGDEWVHAAKLVPNDPESPHHFGYTVGISSDTIVAGTWSDDDMGTFAGSFYVFQREKGAWAQAAELYDPVPDPFDQFGRYVAVCGDVALAGAAQSVNPTGGGGSAHVFRRQGTMWTHESRLVSSDTQPNDRFGSDVAVDGDTLLVGARNADAGGGDQPGRAYVFTIGDPPFTDCNGNGTADACELSGLTAGDCDLDGVLDECEITAGSDDCNANGVPDECEPDEDCNGNEIRDICEIPGGAGDCDGNGVPDACDIAAGDADDCNGNGVPDSCEPVDCNDNGVLDECDIASGDSTDCNRNGLPDDCESTDYQIDDGTSETAVFELGDIMALNRFTVEAGAETVNSISISWSRFMDEGKTAQLLIYDDPDDDGDPIDAVLLSSTTVSVPDVPAVTPGFNRYLIEPTFVGVEGDSFFVAAVAAAGNAAPPWLDTSPYQQSSWLAGASAGQIDVEDLANNATPPERTIVSCAGCAGQWLLRADATHPAGVPNECELRGDVNDDGIVDVVDLLAMFGAWGPCPDPCPAFCAADDNGDCLVDVIDFLALLGNWTSR